MIATYVLIVLAVLVFIGLLPGCSVEKKIRKAQKVASMYPDSFAMFCANAYPVKTQYIKGKDSVHTDTVVVEGKTIPCPAVVNQKGEKVVNNVVCPPSKTIYKDVFRTDTLVKENTAKIEALGQLNSKLQVSNKELTDKLADATKKASNRLYMVFGLAVVLGLGIAAKIGKWVPFI